MPAKHFLLSEKPADVGSRWAARPSSRGSTRIRCLHATLHPKKIHQTCKWGPRLQWLLPGPPRHTARCLGEVERKKPAEVEEPGRKSHCGDGFGGIGGGSDSPTPPAAMVITAAKYLRTDDGGEPPLWHADSAIQRITRRRSSLSSCHLQTI